MIHTGDCLDVMAGMEPESVDAVVTDPPYDLTGHRWDSLAADGKHSASRQRGGFMGKTWDGTGVAFRPETWALCLAVAKPGAHLLAFGGTRTYHRMTVAIEDAGWEIRDCLVWAYASGFPKSLNLPGGLGTALKPAWEPIVMARKPLAGTVAANVARYGTGALAIDACRIGIKGPKGVPASVSRTAGIALSGSADGSLRRQDGTEPGFDPDLGRWPPNLLLTDPIFDGDTPGVVGGGAQGSPANYTRTVGAVGDVTGWGRVEAGDVQLGYGDEGTYSRFFLLPREEGKCRLCGASIAGASSSPPSPSDDSALSPAPIEAFADSDITTGSPITSGTETPFWLDGEPTTPPIPRNRRRETSPVSERPSSPVKSQVAASPEIGTTTTTADRWTCDTCAAAITSRITGSSPASEGDYPRFLLVPKADRADREPVLGGLEPRQEKGHRRTGVVDTPRLRGETWRQNSHPTVKPTELMRHLVRLVTPAGGTVLDPFAGSGSTALAAEMEGFPWILIEREPEYVAIAEARLNGTQRGLGLVS